MNTLKKEKNPCYGCKDRTAECHPVCKLYLNWKEELDANNQKIYAEKYADREVVLMKFDNIFKMARAEVGRKPGYRMGR